MSAIAACRTGGALMVAETAQGRVRWRRQISCVMTPPSWDKSSCKRAPSCSLSVSILWGRTAAGASELSRHPQKEGQVTAAKALDLTRRLLLDQTAPAG